jgi:hypothetical protein
LGYLGGLPLTGDEAHCRRLQSNPATKNSPTNALEEKGKPKEPTKFKCRLLRRRDVHGGELCSEGANGYIPPGPAMGRVAAGSGNGAVCEAGEKRKNKKDRSSEVLESPEKVTT